MLRMLWVAVLAGFAAGALAGDPEAGELRSGLCAFCHGATGMSNNPDIPNIACQQEHYLVKSMLAYRSGERVHPQMRSATAKLSDQEIENLAAYYAAMRCRVRKPKKETDR